MPDAPTLSIGALVDGRYRIEARIGAGGMGVVYRARDERLGRAVALKVVSQKGGATAVRRLQREARAVASLDHRGIAMLFDVLDVGDIGVVLVMELVRGESLRTLIEDEPPRPPRDAARLVLDVAESLGAAHRAGLVHRDVKPDNILVRPDGRTALLDFGIAKAITDRTDDSNGDVAPVQLTGDTTEGLVVGTPAYLAPEQALASNEISGAADQFALAVVAYELLTGASPWKSATSGALLIAQIVGGEAPRPSALRPDLGAPIDDVIAKALAKDPNARFPTIEEFGFALLGAVARVTGTSSAPPEVHASPPSSQLSLPYARTLRVGPEVTTADIPVASPKRHTWAVAAAASTLAVLIVGAIVGVRALRSTVAAPATAPAPSVSGPARPSLSYADVVGSATSLPDAARALHEAMVALRDANDVVAEKNLRTAIALDPSFASAHLQLAILLRRKAWAQVADQLSGRDDFLAATTARETLPPRDRALLEAFEPTFNLLPSDVAATEQRITALGTDTADAQIWNLIGRVRRQQDMLDAAATAFDRELEADPQSAAGLNARAALFTAHGELDNAATAYEQCFRTQPRATLCRFNLISVLEWNGRCEAFVQRAREYAALVPDDGEAPYFRTVAAAAARLPRAAIDEQVQAEPPADRLDQEAWLHEVYGEFDAVVGHLENLEKQSVAGHDAGGFVYARFARLVDLEEMGHGAEAAALAAGYEAKLASLPPIDDLDQLPQVLSVLRHAGKISPVDEAKRREVWLARWRPSSATQQGRFALWISAWARGAWDEADAHAAVAALPAFVDQLPPSSLFWLPMPWSDRENVARVLVLAGDPHARAFVDDAARECVPNFYSIRLHLSEGALYEHEGNVPQACTAYSKLVEAWGHAKPRSVSAEAAEARMRALGCGPSVR